MFKFALSAGTGESPHQWAPTGSWLAARMADLLVHRVNILICCGSDTGYGFDMKFFGLGFVCFFHIFSLSLILQKIYELH